MDGLSLRQFKAIVRKDIVMELRTKEMLTSMGLYTLLTMVVYQVALAAAGETFDVRTISGGLIWLAFIFMSILGLNRSFVHEKDQGCIEALLLSPVDRPVIFFAKASGNLLFMLLVEAFSIPVFMLLFLGGKGPALPLWMLALVLTAASVGIAGLGTLLATISVNTQGRDFLLTVMFIPVIYPLLLLAVSATTAVMNGGFGAVGEFWQAIGLIGGFDAIMLVAAFGLYEFVIGA